MARITGQLQPDYNSSGFKLVLWSHSQLSFRADLSKLLLDFGLYFTEIGTLSQNNHYEFVYFTDFGAFLLESNRSNIFADKNSYHLRPINVKRVKPDGKLDYSLRDNDIVFELEKKFKESSIINFKKKMDHPIFEPLEIYGYLSLITAMTFFVLTGIYGDPDLANAEIRGIYLVFWSFGLCTVGAAKWALIPFWIRNFNENFPEPINLNAVALIYAVLSGLMLLISL